IGLPSAKELDPTLEKQFVSVLGMLVTGRDLSFKQTLDDRCGRWFTAGGEPKKESTGSRGEEELEKRRGELKRTRSKFEELQQSIGRLEAAEDELPRRQNAVKDAEEEFKQLEDERHASSERRQQYAKAKQADEAALRWLRREEEVEEAA